MKPYSIKIILALITFSCVYGMCSKDDATPGNTNPTQNIEIKKGFLSTMGINSIDVQDTLCIRNSTSGTSYTLTDYSWTAEAGSFIRRPRDVWEIINTGTNQWHFKNSAGRYMGYQTTGFISLDETPGPNNIFIMNSTGNKFYIQPAADQSVYLNTLAWDVQPPDPSHQSIRFKSTKQMWWFMP